MRESTQSSASWDCSPDVSIGPFVRLERNDGEVGPSRGNELTLAHTHPFRTLPTWDLNGRGVDWQIGRLQRGGVARTRRLGGEKEFDGAICLAAVFPHLCAEAHR